VFELGSRLLGVRSSQDTSLGCSAAVLKLGDEPWLLIDIGITPACTGVINGRPGAAQAVQKLP